jgi:hypothetical protein
MATDLWIRFRRLLGRGKQPQGLEPILAGWRAEEPPKNSRPAHRRERLDLMKGWVPDNPEHPSNDVNPEREIRSSENGRTRAR